MKLTLNLKRQVLREFQMGWSMEVVAKGHRIRVFDVEEIVRQYLKGKFSLEPKKRLSPDEVLKSVERMPLAERKYFVDRYNGLVPKRRKR